MDHRTPSLKRLKTVLERQDPPSFGAAYVPSILATREEAPSDSSFYRVWWNVQGRYVHALSFAELCVLVIVLYCPFLFELQEQRVIHYAQTRHPLAGHPLAEGLELPDLRGGVDVAESLDLLEYFPTLSARGPEGKLLRIPFIWVADFLLFLKDPTGPFCVNLDIKFSVQDFEQPWGRFNAPAHKVSRLKARHLIEDVRYRDGSIKTVRVAVEDVIDYEIVANLIQLILWQKRKVRLRMTEIQKFEDAFQEALLHGDSANEAMYRILRMRPSSASFHDLKWVFYGAIWKRRLRVDLLQPLLLNRPLRRERVDVLNKYGEWFSRS